MEKACEKCFRECVMPSFFLAIKTDKKKTILILNYLVPKLFTNLFDSLSLFGII